MKTKHFYKTALLAALPFGCVAGLNAQDNTIGLVLGGASVDGNDAAFQRRLQQDGDFYGGISNFHYETGSDVLFAVDGHAVFGNNDFGLVLSATKDGLGYVEAGYKEFRTFYDGSGGYLPGGAPSWVPALNDDLHLDRGEAWFEAGLRIEDLPEVTFRYTHSWRDGQKDSTSWYRAPGSGIGPSLWDIDEQRDIFELDVVHNVGNTELGLGLVYETDNNDNDRIMAATTQTDSYDADLFSAHAYSVSQLNDDMILSFGYAYTTMDTDTDGSSRITTPLSGHNWFNSYGGGAFNQHVVNANFWWQATPCFVIVPSVRAEFEQSDGTLTVDEIPRLGDPLDPTRWELLTHASDTDYQSLTEQIDMRYDGFENILLYARLMASQSENDTNYAVSEDLILDEMRYKDVEADTQKYTIGAVWYPTRCANIAAEYYHKKYESDYNNDYWHASSGPGYVVGGLDGQLASHDITTDDVNVRLTWRPLSNLTLVTRYDWQNITYDTNAYQGDTPQPGVESGESERNIISQSVTYSPLAQMYVTGSVSYVWADTVSAGSQGSNLIASSDNDYLTAGINMGYAIDEKTQVTAGYTYYYAENFMAPAGAVAYGTDLEEHVISLGMTRQLSESMVWNLGYAYYNSNDGTSGGNNDFDAHMVSSGLQVRF